MRGYRLILVIALVVAGVALGRAQWQMQISNTTADLRGIDNVGNGVAWASGTNGTVLRTEDGGYVWQTCAVPPGAEKLDFRGVQAFDANTAIVMSSGKGDLSRLYKTTDGCHTWKLVFTNPDKDGFFDAIVLDPSDLTHSEGWLLGDPVRHSFTLFATEDGGKNWYRQHNKGLRAAPDTQGAFAASNSSLIGCGGFIAFASGGKSGSFLYSTEETTVCVDCTFEESDYEGRHSKWARYEVPVGTQTEASGTFSIAIMNPVGHGIYRQAAVAVGGDYRYADSSEHTGAFTLDGGKNWHPAQTPPHGYRSSVAYDEKTKSWITVGPNGTDISTDDGKNWRAIHPDAALHETADADRNWNALSLPYVVGPKGRIGKLEPAALKK